MLDTSPEKLHELINEAVQVRDAKLSREQERIDRRFGAGYVQTTHNQNQAVNHQHEWLSLMLPKLAVRNPRFKVQSSRPTAQQDTADAVRLFLNRWVKTIRIDQFLLGVAVDYSQTWGAAMITPDVPHGGHTRRIAEDWIPRVTRIPPSRLIIDPHCDGMDTARFCGHLWVADPDAMIEQAKKAAENGDKSWDMAKLRELKGKDTDMHRLGARFKRSVPRNEAVGYDIWVPELITDGMEPDDGFHGSLLTVIYDDGGLVPIRDPRPFWGPAWGPYVHFGCYPGIDDPWPLSPVAAVEGRELDLDTQYRAANKAAAEYKRVCLSPKGGKIPQAFDGQVIEMDAMNPELPPMIVELGGVTDQQLRNIAVMDQQLQRSSGMDAAQSGDARDDTTATAVAVADTATQTRAGFIIDRFMYGVERMCRTAAWYAVKDDRVRLSLGAEAAEALGIQDPVFLGGEVAGEDAPFEALELEIDPMSTARNTEALHQRRTLEFFRIVGDTAPMIAKAPYVDWAKMYGRIGDALNIPDSDEFVDVAMALQMAGMGGQPQGGGGGGVPVPAGTGLPGNQSGALVGAASRA